MELELFPHDSPSRLDEIPSDLSGKPLSCKERGFDSYSPSLVEKGLGVRFSAVYFTQLRTAIVANSQFLENQGWWRSR